MRHEDLPSLQVTQSHVALGKPNAGPHSLAAVHHGEDSDVDFAVASSDHIELVDIDLHLRSTLFFADAFPTTANKQGSVQAIASDDSAQRLAAAFDDHIAIWSKTGTGRYKVHSTFSTGFRVDCLDILDNCLVAGGEALAFYRLDATSEFPSWSRSRISRLLEHVQQVSFSSDGRYVAVRCSGANTAQVILLDSAKEDIEIVCEPWHVRRLRGLHWLPSPNETDATASVNLVTETIDGTLRIWRTLPDETDYFVLWLTIPSGNAENLALANAWLLRGHGQPCQLLRVLSSGKAEIVTIENLTAAAVSAARMSKRSYSKLEISRRQLSVLKFNVSGIKRGRLSILGLSTSGSLGLLRLQDPFNPTDARLQPWKHVRIRPSQNMVRIIPAEVAPRLLTVGERGEVIFWQANRLHDRTASVEAIASHSLTLDESPIMAAISPDGTLAIVASSRDTAVIELSAKKATKRDWTFERLPSFHDLLAIRLDNSNGGQLYLIAVDRRSGVSVWHIDGMGAHLIRQATSSWQAECAEITPQSSSSAARVVLIDSAGQIGLGNVLLEGHKASYRDLHVVQTKQKNTTHVCASVNNYVASIGDFEGQRTLQISNTRSSLFTSGLEYRLTLNPNDLPRRISFGMTPDGLPLLLATFDHRIVIISQQKLDYYQENSMWCPIASTSVPSETPLSDACFTYGGSVAAPMSNQLQLFSRRYAADGCERHRDLFGEIYALTAPLPDYHPQLLMQCLLEGKHLVVDKVLRRLYEACKNSLEEERPFEYLGLPQSAFYADRSSEESSASRKDFFLSVNAARAKACEALDLQEQTVIYTYLQSHALPAVSPAEALHLKAVIHTSAQVEAQRRSLDTNGMRFLISLKSYAATQTLGQPNNLQTSDAAPSARSNIESSMLPRLRYRDVLWGFHSESQEILLQTCTEMCQKPMIWQDAKALCLPLWLQSSEHLSQQIENVARNEFTRGEDRDPTNCSLYYFALRKKRLVQGLWRQATFHKERPTMMKFLMNNFDEPRWKSAAIKNAYALLSKHRFHYAAAFFLLGDSLKDCVAVCIKQLDDWLLAVCIARIYEGDTGPVFQSIIKDHILPKAFANGFRRLASWAFWMIKRRDLSIQVLVTPFAELLASISFPSIKSVGVPGQENPSLVLLYRELRERSLQTLKGSFAIAPIRETEFILHISQVFCRMGCQTLALDLVRGWRFTAVNEQLKALTTKPANGYAEPAASAKLPPRPTGGHHRRRSSLLKLKRRSTIILDVPSAVPSRSGSPEPEQTAEKAAMLAADQTASVKTVPVDESFKRVLKEVKAPPPEFDMASFDF